MHSRRDFISILLCVSFLLSVLTALAPAARAAQPGPPARVVMIAGNGQVVQEEFQTTELLTIQVTDAFGIPVAGVPVAWSITQGTQLGTLNSTTLQTDSNGQSTASFFGSRIQPGSSYASATITASTPAGGINFIETVVPFSTPPPAVMLLQPTQDNLNVAGSAGATLPGAVAVKIVAQGGVDQGLGIPNIGVQIVSAPGNSGAPVPPAPAACNAPAGIVLTDASGLATCDLVLGNTPGAYTVTALGGGSQNTRTFTITITGAQACAFTLSPTSQFFPAAGGSGTVNVFAAAGCSWTAVSNAGFVTISSVASGNGNGTVVFAAAANTGAARSGTISIAGQTFTVDESAGGSSGSSLAITTASALPGAFVNSTYSTTLAASGGQPPYSWQIVAGSLPPGLALAPSIGTIFGAPATAGSFTFTAGVSDSAGGAQSQSFTIVVSASGTGGLAITNTAFPAGLVGAFYSQALTYSAGQCGSPFTPAPVFTLASGALPPGLSVQSNGSGYSILGTPTSPGVYNFTLSVSNTCAQSASASFSITINGAGATTVLSANAQSVAFTASQGGPAPQPQQVLITSTGSSVALTITVATTTGGNWLSGSTSSGATPSTLNVSAINVQSLAPGAYQGSITIAAVGANPLIIPVTLTITAPNGLAITPTSLMFNAPENSTSQQSLGVSSSPAGMPFTASPQTVSGGNWLSIQPPAGATSSSLTVTVNTANLIPGVYTGNVIVTPQVGAAQSVPVILNVAALTLTVDKPSLAFSAQTGATAPASQTVNLIGNGGPIPVTLSETTAAGGNWLFATPSAGAVATAVTVSVSPAGLATGSYDGVIVITPQNTAVPLIKVAVTLTITAGPGPVIYGVTNAASAVAGQVAPGEIVTIYGAAMAVGSPQGVQLTSSNMVSNSVGGAQVLFDGLPAPLTYVSATQINAVAPYEIYGRANTQIQVSYNGLLSASLSTAVAGAVPGIFMSSPGNQAAALNQDMSANSSANPAPAGSIVVLYATGAGQMNPPGVTGALAEPPLSQPLLPVTVQIGGMDADVVYAGAAPGFVSGLLQVNARIPAGVAPGNSVPVTVTVGGIVSNTASIAIGP